MTPVRCPQLVRFLRLTDVQVERRIMEAGPFLHDCPNSRPAKAHRGVDAVVASDDDSFTGSVLVDQIGSASSRCSMYCPIMALSALNKWFSMAPW